MNGYPKVLLAYGAFNFRSYRMIRQGLETKGLSVRDFSSKYKIVQWEDQKRGQTVRIQQILVSFSFKIQIWTHIFDKNFKIIENMMEILSKKGIILKSGSELFQKGVIRWQRYKQGVNGWERVEVKGSKWPINPSPNLVSALPPPPIPTHPREGVSATLLTRCLDFWVWMPLWCTGCCYDI